MAIVATHLTTGQSSAQLTSYVTASITPSPNNLVLVCFCSGQADLSWSVSGCGLTWTRVYFGGPDPDDRHIFLFRALGPAPTTGSLAIETTGNAPLYGIWSVVQFSGVPTTVGGGDAIRQVIYDETIGLHSYNSVTLGSFLDPDNATFGFFAYGSDGMLTNLLPGSGFTLLGRTTTSIRSRIMTEWRAGNDQIVDTVYESSQSGFGRGIGAEIIDVGTPEPPPPPSTAYSGWGVVPIS